MTNLNYDVLRVSATAANIATTLRNNQWGFDTTNNRIAVKDNSGNMHYFEKFTATSADDIEVVDNTAGAFKVRVAGTSQYAIYYSSTDGSEMLQFGAAGATAPTINSYVRDGEAVAYSISSDDEYQLNISTAAGAYAFNFGNVVHNHAYNFQGTGLVSIGGAATVTGTLTASNAFITSGGGVVTINVPNSNAAALLIQKLDGADILKVATDTPLITIGNATTNFPTTFLGTGLVTTGGYLTVSGDVQCVANHLYSLGNASLGWDKLYLTNDGSIIYFGVDQDVSVTHTADTGLTIKGATDRTAQLYLHNAAGNYGRIQFGNNADYYIGGGYFGADFQIACGVCPMYLATSSTARITIQADGSIDIPGQLGYDGSAGGLSFSSVHNASFTHNLGVGASATTDTGLNLRPSALSTSYQFGAVCYPTFTSACTDAGQGLEVKISTTAAEFILPVGIGLHVLAPVIGAGSAITAIHGLKIENQGATHYAIETGTGKVTFGDAVLCSTSLTVTGALTANGAVTLGHAAGDNITITGTIVATTLIGTNNQLQFRDSAIHIASLDDGHLDITADTAIDMNGPVIFNPASDATSDVTINGDTIAELLKADVSADSLTLKSIVTPATTILNAKGYATSAGARADPTSVKGVTHIIITVNDDTKYYALSDKVNGQVITFVLGGAMVNPSGAYVDYDEGRGIAMIYAGTNVGLVVARWNADTDMWDSNMTASDHG